MRAGSALHPGSKGRCHVKSGCIKHFMLYELMLQALLLLCNRVYAVASGALEHPSACPEGLLHVRQCLEGS